MVYYGLRTPEDPEDGNSVGELYESLGVLVSLWFNSSSQPPAPVPREPDLYLPTWIRPQALDHRMPQKQGKIFTKIRCETLIPNSSQVYQPRVPGPGGA